MEKLRRYTIASIKEIDELPAGAFGRTEYFELRNIVCSHLKLFDARRGEPHKMVMRQWGNRKCWLADGTIRRLKPTQRKLISEMIDTLVGDMAPPDCISATERLVMPELHHGGRSGGKSMSVSSKRTIHG